MNLKGMDMEEREGGRENLAMCGAANLVVVFLPRPWPATSICCPRAVISNNSAGTGTFPGRHQSGPVDEKWELAASDGRSASVSLAPRVLIGWLADPRLVADGDGRTVCRVVLPVPRGQNTLLIVVGGSLVPPTWIQLVLVKLMCSRDFTTIFV